MWPCALFLLQLKWYLSLRKVKENFDKIHLWELYFYPSLSLDVVVVFKLDSIFINSSKLRFPRVQIIYRSNYEESLGMFSQIHLRVHKN